MVLDGCNIGKYEVDAVSVPAIGRVPWNTRPLATLVTPFRRQAIDQDDGFEFFAPVPDAPPRLAKFRNVPAVVATLDAFGPRLHPATYEKKTGSRSFYIGREGYERERDADV